MTPKVRTSIAEIQKWSRDNILRLRRVAKDLKHAGDKLQTELGALNAAVARSLQSSQRLHQAVEDTVNSDDLKEFHNPGVELTEAQVGQLLALNRHLRGVVHHFRTVVDDVKPRLEAKLADPGDPMYDYEIEARIDYQLREDDPDFADDDDNYLTTRTESLKSSLYGWEQERYASLLPSGFLSESHCSLFHDLNSEGYGVESPRLSFRDCLRIGRIFVDVQIWQQYEFNAQGGSPCDAKRRTVDDNGQMSAELNTSSSASTSPWSKALQNETRQAIADAPITTDGCLHFKHPTQGLSYVKVDELCQSRILMFLKPSGEKLWFDDVDALLQAGWAID